MGFEHETQPEADEHHKPEDACRLAVAKCPPHEHRARPQHLGVRPPGMLQPQVREAEHGALRPS